MRPTMSVALKIIKFLWGEIKTPLIIIAFFFFAGFGFYQGFVSSKLIDFVRGERVIVITTLDLRTGEFAEQKGDD